MLETESATIRILIAEDHAVVRAGLAALVRSEPDLHVVCEVGNGRDAVEAYRIHRPDVVLMDLRMPGMNGIEATRLIREAYPHAKVIMLTSFEGDEDVYGALRAGAKGYLLKDVEHGELYSAIRKVAVGQKCIPARISAKLVERMGATQLTLREHEVLQLIAMGKTNLEIGRALFISEGTVKTHVNNILSKLGASDRTNAVVTGLRRGLIALEPAAAL
jgi:two-component system NarL family response regulator